MPHLGSGEGEGKDGDVVFLAKLLCSAGDFFGRAAGDFLGAVEAVEFAARVVGFVDAVGEEGEGVAGGELKGGLGVRAVGGEAEGKAGGSGSS